jgi:hypothetical protein
MHGAQCTVRCAMLELFGVRCAVCRVRCAVSACLHHGVCGMPCCAVRCAWYTVQCAVCGVQYCGVQCAVCECRVRLMRCAWYGALARCAMCSVRCAVCTEDVQCAMCVMCIVQYCSCTLRCAVCNVQCAVCNVRCALCGVQYYAVLHCMVRASLCTECHTYNHTIRETRFNLSALTLCGVYYYGNNSVL